MIVKNIVISCFYPKDLASVGKTTQTFFLKLIETRYFIAIFRVGKKKKNILIGTNMPTFGPVVLEIASLVLRKYCWKCQKCSHRGKKLMSIIKPLIDYYNLVI